MAKKSVKEFAFEEIYANKTRNFRHAWKYKVEPKANYDPAKDVPGFYEDVVENGIKTMIEVSLLSPENADRIERLTGIRYKVQVLRGFRRHTAASMVRAQNASLFKRISCITYEGLSEAEEVALMYDHNGIEPLDEYETYNAIISLFATGKSQEAIAGLIGQKRGYVQDRIYIHELPVVVKQEYEKRFTPLADGKMPKKGVDYVHFISADVDKLHKTRNIDIDGGVDPSAPDSQTMKVWDEIANKTVKAPGDKNVKAMTRKEMDQRAGFVKGCEALETAHSFYTGDGGNIEEAARQYRALEAQANLVPALKSRVADLETQVSELTDLLNSKEQDILDLNEQLTSGIPMELVNGVPTEAQV